MSSTYSSDFAHGKQVAEKSILCARLRRSLSALGQIAIRSRSPHAGAMGGNNSKPDEETKTEEEPPAAAAMSPLGRRKSSYGAGLDVLGNEMWKSSRKLGPPPLCWIHVVDEATGLRSPDPYRVEDFADHYNGTYTAVPFSYVI